MYRLKKNISFHEAKLVKFAECQGFEETKKLWNDPWLSKGETISFERGTLHYKHYRGYLSRQGSHLLINGIKGAAIPLSLVVEESLQPLKTGDRIPFGIAPNKGLTVQMV